LGVLKNPSGVFSSAIFPGATNKPAEGRQKNRRVDIEFKGVKK